jgi:ABC-type transporter MlaC component
MKHTLILASLLAVSSLSFAATPAQPASAPTTAAKKAAANTAAVKKYQQTRSRNKASHMKGIHRVVTPRAPAKAASSTK